ncbi:hypothetical protein WBG78_28550 [Chryseolinea sp. T2]|uniref:hypothetical protein n=1 Tax=Chryseolinea sp. T2 TaxID=3129255 RepID=UPI003078537B
MKGKSLYLIPETGNILEYEDGKLVHVHESVFGFDQINIDLEETEVTTYIISSICNDLVDFSADEHELYTQPSNIIYIAYPHAVVKPLPTQITHILQSKDPFDLKHFSPITGC